MKLYTHIKSRTVELSGLSVGRALPFPQRAWRDDCLICKWRDTRCGRL